MVGDIFQPTHLLFVLIVALLVLGPKRLPEVGRQLGDGIRDFRAAINGERNDRNEHEIYSGPGHVEDHRGAADPPPAERQYEPDPLGAFASEDGIEAPAEPSASAAGASVNEPPAAHGQESGSDSARAPVNHPSSSVSAQEDRLD
jgi:sec-independent protein translocase protein TatA